MAMIDTYSVNLDFCICASAKYGNGHAIPSDTERKQAGRLMNDETECTATLNAL